MRPNGSSFIHIKINLKYKEEYTHNISEITEIMVCFLNSSYIHIHEKPALYPNRFKGIGEFCSCDVTVEATRGVHTIFATSIAF